MEVKNFVTEYDKKNDLTYLGESIFARNEQGNLKHHIMTIFPEDKFIVTEPSTLHGDQCVEYINYRNALNAAENKPPLSEEEKERLIDQAVAISIIEGAGERFFAIIRPEPDSKRIHWAFEADEILQKLLPKFRIFFMHTDDNLIRWAIRKRGESWRIQPLPRTNEGMRKTVINNKMTLKLSQRRIYYYNMQTGARYLSYESFYKLNELDCETLRAFLLEIQKYSPLKNREGYSEILFFKANQNFTSKNFQRFDFNSMDEAALRAAHRQLCQEFESAVDPFYRKDDFDNWDWLFSIFSIIANLDRYSTEEYQMGLCEEFSLKITWLPGGRINQDGGIIKDPVYLMKDQMTPSERARFEDGVPQMILFTYVRESFLIEYANIGLVPPIRSSQSTKEITFDGPKPRRSVYIMQVKLKGEKERLSIIRLQKWDIREMLDEGKELLESFNRAEEYTDYILNRRLACNLLKMKLPQYLKVRRFVEVYRGKNPKYQNVPIHTVYYEREYIDGIATDRLTPQYFQNQKNGNEFSVRFARLLGEAAAPNLIVGRSAKELPNTPPIFDDGDEVLQLDDFHMPSQIIVSEQPGTFVYYQDKMENQIAYYAIPMIKRKSFLHNFDQAVDAYVDGFLTKFRDIQRSAEDYRKTFDDLPNKDPGSMFDKWHRVLDRLRDANPDVLADMLHKAIYEGVKNNA
ncbi:MAG: hypothetical protein IKX40_13200 [Thermoguttaceae bacterium]|nr:hypothetical protein [Thermoguttaceae bacterium]